MQPPPSPLPDFAAAAGGRPVVAPFARALSVLSAFAPGERWLGNGDLVERTGLPASTVTRMTRTLVTLGYLRYAADTRRFCLSPSALTLGYRAAADTEIHRAANQRMRLFAERHQVNVHLSSRDRLDLVVIDSCRTSALPAALQPGIGTRLGLASSAAGWALLASLPEAERDYLLQSAEHHPPHGGREHERELAWGQLRRRSREAIGQVRAGGFCVALGESGQPMTVVAAPIQVAGRAPLAVSCLGPASLMGRARSVRELGPALVRMAQEIQLSQGRP
ncbi:IclR family transcriptional regulator [Alicycliphilus denitrificans]|uniref:IclR family transcriptional regulator n=1 Tax=Alicycliphilus denitrificans TaxID=179636 RepID=UPI0001DA0888|nr:IclR family transcriptional regulator [Alicycliphilus denitrificans]ADV00668.1 regulatory protein IclR [Alicycliphilus denitrificans BC]